MLNFIHQKNLHICQSAKIKNKKNRLKQQFFSIFVEIIFSDFFPDVPDIVLNQMELMLNWFPGISV